MTSAWDEISRDRADAEDEVRRALDAPGGIRVYYTTGRSWPMAPVPRVYQGWAFTVMTCPGQMIQGSGYETPKQARLDAHRVAAALESEADDG